MEPQSGRDSFRQRKTPSESTSYLAWTNIKLTIYEDGLTAHGKNNYELLQSDYSYIVNATITSCKTFSKNWC